MREANQTDFFVEMPFGTFRFGRRTYRDRMHIRAEYLKRTKELADVDDDLSGMAQVAADYSVLCVECPKGWESLDDVDLIANPDAENQIWDLYLALKKKECSFRGSADAGGEGAGQGTGGEPGVLVPAPLSTSAD